MVVLQHDLLLLPMQQTAFSVPFHCSSLRTNRRKRTSCIWFQVKTQKNELTLTYINIVKYLPNVLTKTPEHLCLKVRRVLQTTEARSSVIFFGLLNLSSIASLIKLEFHSNRTL